MAVERRRVSKMILNTKEPLLISGVSHLCFGLAMMTPLQVKENSLRM